MRQWVQGGVGPILLVVGMSTACAAATDLQERRSEAELQQTQLRLQIEGLQKNIDAREATRKEAADALKQSESAISRINLRLRELAQAEMQAQTDLKGLTQQISVQQTVMAKRRVELANQLRAQYTHGLSPWTALLSGEDPQALGRNLGYLGYVSQARAAMVDALQADIAQLAVLQTKANTRRAEIEKGVLETAQQKVALERQQKERASVLAQLEGQIRAQRVEANKLGRDDKRLSSLITDLEGALARQAEQARLAEAARRAEAARKQAEMTRRAEEARKKADADRKALEQARQEQMQAAQAREQVEAAVQKPQGPVDPAHPEATGLRTVESGAVASTTTSSGGTDSTPPSRSTEADPSSQQSARVASVASTNGLQHGLPMPVRGQIQGRFGLGRPDGGVWRGVVLRAAEGTPVKAVAGGTVVYAAWLRGFGNLLIVDHGQQYLSVYGYNQSLLKRVGDVVERGDTIATVGATGGQVESGLYFEIRHRGAPVDPAQWLAQ